MIVLLLFVEINKYKIIPYTSICFFLSSVFVHLMLKYLGQGARAAECSVLGAFAVPVIIRKASVGH